MRSFPRPAREQYRLGNVLADVSGEIRADRDLGNVLAEISGEIEAPAADLAEGTGTHRMADSSELPTARLRALPRGDS